MYSSFYNANISASAKTANILAGDVNEFVTQNSLVRIYGVSSAIGVRISVLADSDVAVDDKEISSIGTTLDKQAHLIDQFQVWAGTRLAIFLRETAAAATTDIYTGVEILPM